MVSLFRHIDKRLNPQGTFWCELQDYSLDDINTNTSFSSNLLFLNTKNQMISRNAILTSSSIYRCKRGTSEAASMSIVKWKQVHPFVEDNGIEKRLGFTLGNETIFQIFYVDRVELLDQWIEKLSEVAIVSDLENDYYLIKELGKGGFGTVFQALNRENSSQFAVKAFKKKSLEEHPFQLTSIISEIETLRYINHDMIIKIHRLYESSSTISIVLDYVAYGNLLERIQKRKKFSEQKAGIFIMNLLLTLQYLHGMNITHRDLKPDNILMTSEMDDTQFKVCDFGLACMSEAELTQNCGSIGYIAPEILNHHQYTKNVDIYGAGIILYILLSGLHPFLSSTHKKTLAKNKIAKISFAGKEWKRISKDAIDLTDKLTKKDPDQRISIENALSHPFITRNQNDEQRYFSAVNNTPVRSEHFNFTNYLYNNAIYESYGD